MLLAARDETDIVINSYCINESHFLGECPFSWQVNDYVYKQIVNGERAIYFSGEIEYVDLVTSQPRVYRFMVLVDFPTNKIHMIANDNLVNWTYIMEHGGKLN